MTPSEAAKLVALLQAAYPNARWSEGTIGVYEMVLVDQDFNVTGTAIHRLIRSTKFLPTIAEILEVMADIAVGPTRSGVDAWGDVGMAIRRIGSYGLPKFDDPIVAECVKALGWRHLCCGEASEAADRKNFCDMYNDLARRRRVLDVSEPGRLLPERSEQPPELPDNVRKLVQGVGRR